MATQETDNDAKRIGGYLKEKWTIGMSRVDGDECVRAIAKVTSHKLKSPNEKHLARLIAATHGSYNSGGTQYDDINGWIVDQLDLHTHSRNWVVVLKTLLSLHTLMNEGSDEVMAAIVKKKQTFNTNHMKDLADSPDGAAQEQFIHRYARYLEERCVAYGTFKFHSRIEAEEFPRSLCEANADSAAPIVRALLLQLQTMIEIDLRVHAMNNFASLDAMKKAVGDGKRIYVVLTRRVMKMLDEFNGYSPKVKEVWLALFKTYHKCSKQLSDLFIRMNNNPVVQFGESFPSLQTFPDSMVAALEQTVEDDDMEVEKVSLASITKGVSGLSGRKSPDLFKKKPTLPPNTATAAETRQEAPRTLAASTTPSILQVDQPPAAASMTRQLSPPPAAVVPKPDPLADLFDAPATIQPARQPAQTATFSPPANAEFDPFADVTGPPRGAPPSKPTGTGEPDFFAPSVQPRSQASKPVAQKKDDFDFFSDSSSKHRAW